MKLRDQECRQCDYKTSNISDLRRHVKIVHDKIKDYECTVCGHKCGTNTELSRHVKIHKKVKQLTDNTRDQERTKEYDCTGCDLKFCTLEGLIEHGLHCTSDSFREEFVCIKCGFASAKVAEWTRHVKPPCGREN